MEARSIGKKTLKVAGAACAATGIMAASALVASGAAVGAVVEGFVAARKAVAEIIKKDTEAETGEQVEPKAVQESEFVEEVAEQPMVLNSEKSAE